MEIIKCVVIIIISSVCGIYSLDKAIDGVAIKAVPRNDVPPSMMTIVLHIIAFGICMAIDVSAINHLIHFLPK